MSIFQPSVVSKYQKHEDPQLLLVRWQNYSKHFLNYEIQTNIWHSKEESYQEGFLDDLFVKILGYTKSPKPNFNLVVERKNQDNAEKADGAIVIDGKVIAVIELKDTKTVNLKTIENQAFGYKNHQPDCQYVITANFRRLRLYIDNAVGYEEFDLFSLTQEDFARLHLCLAYTNLRDGIPRKLKEESNVKEIDITSELYRDYSGFKKALYANLIAENPTEEHALLYQKSQKLLDRILFILFAEDCGLLHPNSVAKIIKDWALLKSLDAPYQTLYERFKLHFGYLDTGRESATNGGAEIFAYNGGLFAPDDVLDRVKISDDVLKLHALKLADYNFASEVDVNILGHIFENSLHDQSRKKDGIFYTPNYITKYIVENTLGKLCTAKKIALELATNLDSIAAPATKKQKLAELAKIDDYRDWLLSLTVCDPACGSGAFLNAALDFLIAEHQSLDELATKISGDKIVTHNLENHVLENNIFGVDINEDAVEIAKLSLWLRTARPRRKLNDLADNIKCGNSLISDATIAGDKAFNWEKEFPEIFANGGFDVIIGNPPYGANIDNFIEAFERLYPETSQGFKDIYKYFFNRAIDLIKPSGMLGFITPNTFFRQPRYADLRKLLLKFSILQLVDLGENVFNEAVPTAITLLSKTTPDKTLFADLSKSTTVEITITDFRFTAIEQKLFAKTPNNIFVEYFREKRENEFLLDEILEMKDAGFKYQRSNVGMAAKGNNDLTDRIFYDGNRISAADIPILVGKEIHEFYCSDCPHKVLRGNYAELLRENETTYFNKAIMNADVKLIWRQTAPYFIGTVLDKPIFFGNTIQAGIIKDEFRDRISYLYLCCLLNSKYLRQLYENNVKEAGRVFPQVKLEKLKPLPIIIAENQQPFIALADKMLSLTKDLQECKQNFLHLVTDNLANVKINKRLADFANIEFNAFLKELEKQKSSIPHDSQPEWRKSFTTAANECRKLAVDIAQTDAEIDKLVYELYGLTKEEIEIVEKPKMQNTSAP